MTRPCLQSFADQAAIAVSNAQLYSQVTHEKRRISALLDSAADGILILAADHHIEHCNPSMAKMLGDSAANVRGKLHEEVIRWKKLKNGSTLEQAEAGGWPLPTVRLGRGHLERVNGLRLSGA